MPRKQAVVSNSGGNGIMGSGIFGVFGSVTSIQCTSNDNSMYCNMMKVFNVIFSFFFFLFIMFIVYAVFMKWYRSRSKK